MFGPDVGNLRRQVNLAARHVRPQPQQASPLIIQEVPSSPRRSLSEDDDAGTPTALSVSSLEDPSRSVSRIERENFLVFIKILFKILEDNPTIRARAQRLVMECRRRNQRGDPDYVPLMNGVERHLHGLVGEARWRRSHLLLHHYIVSRRGRSGTPPTNPQQPTAIMVGK